MVWCLVKHRSNLNQLLSLPCVLHALSLSPWFDHPNTPRRVQIMKLVIVQFSPASCYFLSLMSQWLNTLNTLFSNIVNLRLRRRHFTFLTCLFSSATIGCTANFHENTVRFFQTHWILSWRLLQSAFDLTLADELHAASVKKKKKHTM
jgi:hypothetical protein